jgi:hypothetical protein
MLVVLGSRFHLGVTSHLTGNFQVILHRDTSWCACSMITTSFFLDHSEQISWLVIVPEWFYLCAWNRINYMYGGRFTFFLKLMVYISTFYRWELWSYQAMAGCRQHGRVWRQRLGGDSVCGCSEASGRRLSGGSIAAMRPLGVRYV